MVNQLAAALAALTWILLLLLRNEVVASIPNFSLSGTWNIITLVAITIIALVVYATFNQSQ